MEIVCSRKMVSGRVAWQEAGREVTMKSGGRFWIRALKTLSLANRVRRERATGLYGDCSQVGKRTTWIDRPSMASERHSKSEQRSSAASSLGQSTRMGFCSNA